VVAFVPSENMLLTASRAVLNRSVRASLSVQPNLMTASFDRAITDGAVIEGMTRLTPSQARQSHGVNADEIPPKVPQTLQDNQPLDADTEKADAENPVNNWICLASAMSVLPLSYPART
jgi:hypothetical protein